jgi:uncharacterized cupin superfamily protein
MKVPFKCPICGGNGLVPHGFYNQTGGQWSSTDTTPETCRSCNGSGIVYVEQDNKLEYDLNESSSDTTYKDNKIMFF